MSGPTEQRRLAAIMFTDMVGYTALAQRNEALALELLEEHRRILRSIFPRFNGTEIKTIGDAFLVEFQSALEAAQCALEIQRTLAKRNHDVSSDHRIESRIGIHVGDIVHREGDVYGDGVNIASRIQPVAGIGGICISVDVERQIHNALEARFEKLAPVELKNVQVPMDLFRIVLLWERDARLTDERQRQDVRQQRSIPVGWVVAAVFLLVVIGASVFVFQRQKTKAAPRQSEAATASTISEKSIAVLPFENLSEEKANAFFTDGVQDEILTDLAKIADLKVISRTSVMQYKSGLARNLRKIGEELGVAHVVEGSVQRAANKIRVNAQLIDARNDAHLWAKTYDRDLADVFAIETELAQLIANELQAKLSAGEKASIEEKPMQDLVAYDFYVRATPLIDWVLFSSTKKKDLSQAVDLLNQAIARDPAFLLAYCRLASAHDSLYFQGFDRTPARLALAKSAIDAAFRLKPDAGEAHLALASHLYYGYFDYDRSRAELAVAQRTLPNNPQLFELEGFIDRRQGRWSEAVRNAKRAGELDPRNVYMQLTLAIDYWLLREYDLQYDALTRVLALDPGDFIAPIARAHVEFYRRADTRPWRAQIEKVLAEDPARAEDDRIKQDRFRLAIYEHDPVTADRIVATLPEENSLDDDFEFSRDFWQGVIARMQGEATAANAAFTAARTN